MDLEPIVVRHAEENKNHLTSEQIEEQKISAPNQKKEHIETVHNIMNGKTNSTN